MEIILLAAIIFFSGYISGECAKRGFSVKKSFFVGLSIGIAFTLVLLAIGVIKKVVSGSNIELMYIVRTLGFGLFMSLVIGVKCSTQLD